MFTPFVLETFNPLQIQYIDVGRPTVAEGHFNFNEQLFNECPDWVTLQGFFQSEKYFMNVRHQLLEDFKFKPEIREVCDGAMVGMHKPIALHVRRTDYAQYNHHPIVV